MKKEQSEEKRGRKAGVKALTPLQKIRKYAKEEGLKTYRFNYKIPAIDQKNILENGWDLDIIDIAIFNQIHGFISSGKADKVTDYLGDWFFVSEYKTLKDLPCVPLSSKNAVYKRISKLVECGLIERNPTNRLTGKKYIRVSHVGYEKLTHSNIDVNRNDDKS